MSIYRDWGFKENPFQTTALKPDEEGQKLLIGRDKELEILKNFIRSRPKIVTVEGVNGVGKTSLINVAAFELYISYIRKDTDELYIPCAKTFQLDPTSTPENFTFNVLLEVAQTLILQAEILKKHYSSDIPKTDAIDAWMNSPQIEGFEGGLSILSMGGNWGKSKENNTSSGFEVSGFNATISKWLRQIFPNDQIGGVVCVIDNLELLQTTKEARAQLENLRDVCLNLPGIRWVLCGASGIIHSLASSPRLEGFLHVPIELKGVELKQTHIVIETRVEALTKPHADSYLPFTSDKFQYLYRLLNGNLRNSLSKIDNYCMSFVGQKDLPKTDADKDKKFEEWLEKETKDIFHAIENQVGGKARAWEIFQTAIDLGGVFSPGDFEKFKCKSPQALRPLVKDLEDVGLLTSIKDDDDQRRKTVQVTPKGYFVAYARAKRIGQTLELPLTF